MKPTLRLEGAKELERALRALPQATAKRLIRPAMIGPLEKVAKAAKGLVPVDEGDLQRSIGTGYRLTRRQARSRRAIADHEAYVGPGIAGNDKTGWRHGHLVEFGTVDQPPRPYMRPAWSQNLRAVFDSLAGNMKQILAKVTAKARARGR